MIRVNGPTVMKIRGQLSSETAAAKVRRQRPSFRQQTAGGRLSFQKVCLTCHHRHGYSRTGGPTNER